MEKLLDLQMFASPEGTVITTDLEPAISIDFASRLSTNINELQRVLGIVDMEPMNAGQTVKIYKTKKTNSPAQVGEGEVIPLTHFERKLANTIELTLNKYRKSTTAEAIQRSGRSVAINKTDNLLLNSIQAEIKSNFFKEIAKGTGTATGETLQSTLANTWDALKKYYQDMDATPIYFVSSTDVAQYLGTAQVTTQTAFGLTYIENFLGLGTTFVTPSLEKGKVIATAKENLNGVYVPANTGDVATAFNLTADSTGFVGMVHSVGTDTASVNTLAMAGVVFYPEFIDGVIVGTITPASSAEDAHTA